MPTKKVKKAKARSPQTKRIPPKNAAPTKAAKPFQNSTSRTTSAQSISSRNRYINGAIFSLLVIGTLFLYSADLHLGFFRIDDQQYVVNNPWIKEISTENIRQILTTPYFVNYSPVHLFSYMLDYAVAGNDAYGFHLSSNLWAGVVAGFVFLVALALTKKRLIAVLASMLFVVHPAHVEAVVWISSRKDLVATAFVLPSLLAYLQYRKTLLKKWYLFSLALFILALAGKLSVATFPAVFLAIDLFIEKRPLLRSLIDKIPFLAVAAAMALIVAQAQPQTGSHPDAYILVAALLQNLWLSTGFGSYVIYRVAPMPQNTGVEVVSGVLLVAAWVLPVLLRRRFPLVTTLVYWILFAFLPTQVLSFAYPVTDRYLFLPSVAAVIIFTYAISTAVESITTKPLLPSIGITVIIAILWARTTVEYLNEWNDPRSVWYAASKKSSDPLIYYNLGWNYMDKAATLGNRPRRPRLSLDEETNLASLLWQDNRNLESLLSEWKSGLHAGTLENLFQADLRGRAHAAFDQALVTKGKHIMPDFYFHRGMLYLDDGNLAEAKREFLNGINEASRTKFTQGGQEVLVNCYYNLGILEWNRQNFQEALKWMKTAEEEQQAYGGNWFPQVTDNRQKLEQIIKSLQQK